MKRKERPTMMVFPVVNNHFLPQATDPAVSGQIKMPTCTSEPACGHCWYCQYAGRTVRR